MKLSRVIMFLLIFGILGMATHFAIDSDTWWHLKAGEWMIENREVIRSDPFSYTRGGTPWQYPGVWVQAGLYLLFNWFGPGGLNIWVAIMIAAIFFIVWKMTAGNELTRAALILLAVLTSSLYWSARPYLITFLLFTIIYYLLDQYYRKDTGSLWLLPVLMIVWVNSHGGFLAGFILMLPFLADGLMKWLADKRQLRTDVADSGRKTGHLLVVFGLMFAASLVTPHFWRIWQLPFTTFGREAEQLLITEWQSPNFHDSFVLPFAGMLLLSIVILGGTRKKVSVYELLLLAGFGFLGLLSMRNIFFFSIIATPIFSRYLIGIFNDIGTEYNLNLSLNFNKPPGKIAGLINYLIVVIIGLVALIYMAGFLPASANEDHFKERFPIEAVEFLKKNPQDGRIFNSYNFGGYLIWALEEYPVYVDGRADLFGDEIILPYFDIYSGSEDWQGEFDRWNIQTVLVEPRADIVQNLKLAAWEVIYEDDVAIIMVADQ